MLGMEPHSLHGIAEPSALAIVYGQHEPIEHEVVSPRSWLGPVTHWESTPTSELEK